MVPSALARDAAWLKIATGMASAMAGEQQLQQLVETICEVMPCDAVALLRRVDQQLVPVAVHGLAPEIIGQQFDPLAQPRLAAILAAAQPVRFAADAGLADPFDGWLAADRERDCDVHACIGCSLQVEGQLVGVLTLDALTPGAFDEVADTTIAAFAALAAAALRNMAMVEALAAAGEQQRALARELVQDAARREGELVGSSAAMASLRQEIRLVAATELAVLISGETGTGKELVARTLHAQSRRADQPLVQINCAALPESLAESELFGHVRGAFSGASSDRAGKFELANGGSLLLDEIGELPLALQAKLLRALQQGEIQRVGSDRLLRVDVRIIAATNRDLEQEVAAGRFRRDLYHRLKVYPLLVPPLRQHMADLDALCGYFLDHASRRLGLSQLRLHPLALAALRSYDWPGNVRELEHLLTRASLKASRGGDRRPLIRAEHLELTSSPAPVASGGQPELPATTTLPVTALPAGGLREAVDDYQRQLISATLAACHGNWAEAARRLHTDRASLSRLARRLELGEGD